MKRRLKERDEQIINLRREEGRIRNIECKTRA
jgi:hypothetical protein